MVVRYSQIYARPDTLSKDSKRMRKRVEVLFRALSKSVKDIDLEIGRRIEAKCGIDVIQDSGFSVYVSWSDLFATCEIRDVLDAPSLAREVLLRHSRANIAETFIKEFSIILEEESIGFLIDSDGVVHPRVDLEFERNRLSAIASLQDDKYSAARSHVKSVEEALLAEPLEGRAAVRAAFDVVENIFKVNFPNENKLNSQAITSKLAPRIQRIYSQVGSPVFAMKQIEGLKSWVDAAHPLRHAGGNEVLNEPSEEIVLHMVSLGLSYSRWLATILVADKN